MKRIFDKTYSRRAVLAGGAATLAAPLVARFSPAMAQEAKLSIGVLRAPAAGVISIGEKNGAFKEAGLALETVLFASAAGPKIVQALGGEAFELSFVNSTAALLALAAGAVPLRMISIPTDPSKLFAVVSGQEIDSVEKLAGKRVAATEGTALHYFLARVLAKHGMKMSDIEFVNLPAAEGQAAFVAGQVDAIVPSVNGRFYLMNTKKDARELFTYDAWEKEPNGQPFKNYDLFVTTEKVVDVKRDALKRFLTGYHGGAVPYVMDPATRQEALGAITEYVNTEQKNPTDPTIMGQIIDNSEFYDLEAVKKIVTGDEFRESLETQVKFFTDLGRIKSAPDLDKAIVTDIL